MMRKLDQRGAAAFEFCAVAAIFFTLVFTIFDLGRYAITMQSLRALSNAGARATMIHCYTDKVTANTSPASCTSDYLSTDQKKAIAPFLYTGGLSPAMSTTVSTTPAGSALEVKASLPAFKMIFASVWGESLNAPSASTKIPY